MDRKNFLLGMACMVGAFALFFFTKPAPAPAGKAPVAAAVSPGTPVVAVAKTVPALAASGITGQAVEAATAQRFVRENDAIRVTFTSRGGAVEKVELIHEYADVEKNDRVFFNQGNSESALTLAVQNPITKSMDVLHSEFKVQTPEVANAITLVGTLADGSKVIRSYSFAARDVENTEPYSLRFSTKVIPATAGVPAPRVWVSTGCWRPTVGDSANQFLSVLASDGDELTRVGLDVFTDSNGLFGLGAHKAEAEHPVASVAKPLAWVASGNQFFASIVRADPAVRGVRTDVRVRPVEFDGGKRGVQAFASWESPLGADLSSYVEGDFFVGPKEYARLAALPDSQVSVLQFSKLLGFISFGAICKLLLACLGGVHWLLAWSGSWAWGWAVVVLTILIKVITWPLTATQQKAAKKMQKFAKPMQDIREKHKDNPEKMQKELMKLYQDNKINPFAGCLPILIQMPIFFGLYTAFQTTVELRLHSFLWVSDLSAPDTLFHIANIPVNILPILMGLTMWQSMRMTPNPSADSSQKTIFLMMTLLFPVICYTMPAALTLYMTVQNLLTMLQAWLTKDEAVEVILPPSGKKAKG